MELVKDSSEIRFGANQDVTLTHVHDTGLKLTGTSNATNGVKELLNIVHQTSGTPAGIGTDLAFTVQTSAGDHKGMILEALTTDVGSGTEDFDFVLKLMEGGATAAEKLR